MIMMVLNKSKLKKIIISVVIILISIIGVVFMSNKGNTPTFNLFFKADEPYYNGTKEEWDLIIKEDNWNENTCNYDLIFNSNNNYRKS